MEKIGPWKNSELEEEKDDIFSMSDSEGSESTQPQDSVPKKGAIKKRRPFLVNTTQCRHELPLLKRLIELNAHWEEIYIRDKWAHMMWVSPVPKEDNLALIQNTRSIFNRYPGLSVVSNKLRLS